MTITRYHFNSFDLGCHFDHGNEFQSMQPTIIEMVKASEYDALSRDLAAARASLDEALVLLRESRNIVAYDCECRTRLGTHDEGCTVAEIDALLRKVGP